MASESRLALNCRLALEGCLALILVRKDKARLLLNALHARKAAGAILSFGL
jgi:hypothetical protein